MAKPFFEVFPALKLDNEKKDLMEQAQVVRVSATRNKDFLRIYVESDRLIQKETIFQVEKEIKKQLFPSANMTVKIYEKFHLSMQYNPETLFDVYKESILLEVREYSHLLHNILKNADFLFKEEGKVTLMIADTVLAKGRSEELFSILDKIINERCGMNAQLVVEYKEAETGKFKDEDERKIAFQVAQISARARSLRGENVEEPTTGMAVPAEEIYGENKEEKPAVKEVAAAPKAAEGAPFQKGGFKKKNLQEVSSVPTIRMLFMDGILRKKQFTSRISRVKSAR